MRFGIGGIEGQYAFIFTFVIWTICTLITINVLVFAHKIKALGKFGRHSSFVGDPWILTWVDLQSQV